MKARLELLKLLSIHWGDDVDDFVISHEIDTTTITFLDGSINKNYRIVATKGNMTADVEVWITPPNLRSTEEEQEPLPHLFFRTSDGQFLNIGGVNSEYT